MRHLLAFFALGALLFLAKGRLAQSSRAPARPTLTVYVAASAQPAESERAIDEALLIEEAMRSGAALIDPVVREQLLSSMRAQASEGDDDAALLARALELGLHRADVVTRQRLVFQAEQLLTERALREPVANATLRAYLAAHEERYRLPVRSSFCQVLVSRARHADTLAVDAATLLSRLQLEPASHAGVLGDPTLLPRELESVDDRAIDASFGAGFAASLRAARPGQWAGPIASAYGLHLVLVHVRGETRLPSLDSLRPRLLADYRHDRRGAVLRARLRELRTRYQLDLRKGRA